METSKEYAIFQIWKFSPLTVTQENILVRLDGRACLCDFGLSVILDGQSTECTSEEVGGTLSFWAPELLESGRKTIQADIYAFACACIEVRISCSA